MRLSSAINFDYQLMIEDVLISCIL